MVAIYSSSAKLRRRRADYKPDTSQPSERLSASRQSASHARGCGGSDERRPSSRSGLGPRPPAVTDGRAAYVRSEDSTLTIGVDHVAVAPDAGERIATDDPDVRIPPPELVEDGCRSVTGEYAPHGCPSPCRRPRSKHAGTRTGRGRPPGSRSPRPRASCAVSASRSNDYPNLDTHAL